MTEPQSFPDIPHGLVVVYVWLFTIGGLAIGFLCGFYVALRVLSHA